VSSQELELMTTELVAGIMISATVYFDHGPRRPG